MLSAMQTGSHRIEIHCNRSGLYFLKMIFQQLYTTSCVSIELDVLSDSPNTIKKLIVQNNETDFYKIHHHILQFNLGNDAIEECFERISTSIEIEDFFPRKFLTLYRSEDKQTNSEKDYLDLYLFIDYNEIFQKNHDY